MRVMENTAAPTMVKASEKPFVAQGSPTMSQPSSAPQTAPNAAIVASARSTKITLREMTWMPR